MIFGMKIDDSEKGYERDKEGRDYGNNNDMNMMEKQKGVTMIAIDKRKGREYDGETK
jgi:hypothetical protein